MRWHAPGEWLRTRRAASRLGRFHPTRRALVKLQFRESKPEVGNTVGGLQVKSGVEVMNRGLRDSADR